MRNKAQLIGNLGGAPDVKTFGPDNKKVARVGMATNESYKNPKGEWVQETTWHNVVFWGKQAETAERLFKKGTELVVEGKIVNRSYEDKDGQKRYTSEIHVNEFLILDKKADGPNTVG